ncbi:hypothetical protein LTR95_014340 [Oleoguttula sp. CCFEE 5521]
MKYRSTWLIQCSIHESSVDDVLECVEVASHAILLHRFREVKADANDVLVDGLAQRPFKGALGETIPGTGLFPEARVTKGRGYALVVLMTGLGEVAASVPPMPLQLLTNKVGTAKNWVLYDFKRRWPKALKDRPALFVKFQEFKPGK